MPDPVTDALLLAAALACSTAGLAWLALTLDTHWQQVKGRTPAIPVEADHAEASRGTVLALRVLGALALLASLLICLRADHATMASLVWVMALAAGALIVAFTLAWRPRWLAPLVAWSG